MFVAWISHPLKKLEHIYIYIDSGGVVRTLIFTFLWSNKVFAGQDNACP